MIRISRWSNRRLVMSSRWSYTPHDHRPQGGQRVGSVDQPRRTIRSQRLLVFSTFVRTVVPTQSDMVDKTRQNVLKMLV